MPSLAENPEEGKGFSGYLLESTLAPRDRREDENLNVGRRAFVKSVLGELWTVPQEVNSGGDRDLIGS